MQQPRTESARRLSARRLSRATHVLTALMSAIACTGTVNDRSNAGADREPPATPSAADQGSPPAATPGEPTTAACRADAIDPGRWLLRRLTTGEYTASVRDLLGTPDDVLARVRLHEDGSPGLFDNNAEQQKITPQHAERYAALAAEIAAELVTGPRREAIIGCDPTGGNRATCTREFVERFGKRAYRRPLVAEERDGLIALAMAEAVPLDGIGTVVRAVLGSPGFLFRPELGVPAPERPGLRRLTGFEIATRLSYLLRGTTPSADLLARADRGELEQPEALGRAARELLATPEGKAALRQFAHQWLGVRRLATTERSKTKFPAWGDPLRGSMADETSRLFDAVVWGDKCDALDLINARYTFVDGSLAKLYGMPTTGAAWQRVELGPGTHRAGVLTHASLLTATGRADSGLSAIWRGKFVREALLCQELQPAPADIPEFPDPSAAKTDRERLEEHRTAPRCAGCHSLMDPIGFGLDRYDSIGSYRERDDTGASISALGEIVGENDATFDGGVALADRLRAMPRVASCIVAQVRDYALGRNPTDADRCLTAHLEREFETSGHDLRSTLVAFVTSDAFRYRR